MIKILARSSVLSSEKKEEIKYYKDIIVNLFAPKTILRTDLIFDYDTVAHNHIENYIEDKQNLLFLGLLENGTVVGAFSRCNYRAETKELEKNT